MNCTTLSFKDKITIKLNYLALEKKLLENLAVEIGDELCSNLTRANNPIEFEGYFAKTVREINAKLWEKLSDIHTIVGQSILVEEVPTEPVISNIENREDLPF
jgi:hypothetical protein